MKIYTRDGDDGTTGLLYGGRVPKNSPAPVAYGAVDEAQAALGVARAEADGELAEILVHIERDLWVRGPNAVEWAAILYNVFLVFGVSQLLWFRLATILPPVASSLSVMLIPVVGLFSGMAFLGEQPTWHDYAALGCVLVAIATVLLPRAQQHRSGA